MRSHVRFAFITVLAMCLMALAGGCANGGGQSKQSNAAVESIRATRQQLASAKQHVNKTLAAMNALAPGSGDLQAAHKNFSKEVSETESWAASAKTRAEDMRARGEQYVAAWDKELKAISNPELREGAEKRRASVRENYDKIRAAAHAAKEAYQPFIKDLHDIQAATAMDLTPAGAQAVKPAFDKARKEGQTLNERIDALMAEIDRVAGAMAPAS
jgi:hypothetical protein